ncbi:MAG: AlpA family phage regulatory protein [Candidatus Thiodiazotropha endolucinida]
MSTTVQLPETGFLRINQIIGDAAAEPPIPPIIPVCKSAWYAGVKNGKYPKSIKLTPRTIVWRVEDIRALVKKIGDAEDSDQAA